MRRTLTTCIVAVAVTCASVAMAEPVAFIVAMKGPVTVAAVKGVAAKASLGRPLERGDKVTVGSGGTASLFFSDGNIIELSAGSSMTVGGKLSAADAKRIGPGSGVSNEVFTRVSKFITSDKKQAGLVALSPMRGAPRPPLLIEPRVSALLSNRPQFAWRSIGGASRYQITVTNEAGAVWTREVSDTTLAYPADADSLAAGSDYTWEVMAMSDTGPIPGEGAREQSTFHVLSEGEAEQVRDHLGDIQKAAGNDSEAGRYLAGSYLVGRGLYADAARSFEELVRLAPQSPGPHDALANVYQTVGLPERAKSERARAKELGGN